MMAPPMEPAEQQVLFPIVGDGGVKLAEVACFCLPAKATEALAVVPRVPSERVDQINRILTDARAGETDQNCAVRPVRVRFSTENFCGSSFSLALALADKRARLGPGVVKPARIIATGIIRAGCRGLVDPVECFEAKLAEIAKIANLEDIVVVPLANIAPETTVERHWQEMSARGVRCFAIKHLDEVSFLWGSVDHPYIGLRAFTKNESRIFFGREREINDLVKELRDNPDHRFLAVVGASGTGKSSLVYAGLLPRLERNEIEGSAGWPVAPFMPRSFRGDPFSALAVVLKPLLPQSYVETPDDISEALANDPERILQYVDQALAGAPASAQLVLVVDQMEDLFTQVEEKHRKEFVELLAKAAEHARVRIIGTLRIDFLTEAQRYPPLDIWLQRPFMLAPPGPMVLAEMILGPARVAGIKIGEGLVDKILKDVGNDTGAMALIAFTMNKLYQRNKDEPPRTLITIEDYDSIEGGIHGAISENAEKMLVQWQQKNKLSDYDKESAIRKIFEHLVDMDITGREFPRRANRNDFEYNQLTINLLDYLVSRSRLLICTDTENCTIVELAHDALLERWPRLAEWIRENREKKILRAELGHDAAKWRRTRDKSLLWTGQRLKNAKKILNDLHRFPPYNETENIILFIKASIHTKRKLIATRILSVFSLSIIPFPLMMVYITPSALNRTVMPVENFDPNPFGLYNFLGNVWEWTGDCLNVMDSSARAATPFEWCLARGGSLDNYEEWKVHEAYPLALTKEHQVATVGFRVARKVDDTEKANVGKVFDDCPDCPKVVILRGGPFKVRVPERETEPCKVKRLLEVPPIEPFAIGQYEVTVGEWSACVREGHCRQSETSTDQRRPIANVSWNDARDYVKWLSERTGKGYRLPDGVEWQYAARGNTDTCWPWGDELGRGNANCEACGLTWTQFFDWLCHQITTTMKAIGETISRSLQIIW